MAEEKKGRPETLIFRSSKVWEGGKMEEMVGVFFIGVGDKGIGEREKKTVLETRCFKSSQSLQERITPKNTHYKINPFGGFTSLLTLIMGFW